MTETAASTPVAAEPAVTASSADDVEKDHSPDFEAVVTLTEVETRTGEEDEDVIFKIRAKLFRFDKERAEWKERGTGDVRLLQHRETKKIRILMRREKTLKICLNHFVNVASELKENVGSDRSWVLHAVDYADGEKDDAMLAIRFKDSVNAESFKKFYNAAKDFMKAKAEGAELPALPVQEVSTEPKGENVPDKPKAGENGNAKEEDKKVITEPEKEKRTTA